MSYLIKPTNKETRYAEANASERTEWFQCVEFCKRYAIGDVFLMKETCWNHQDQKEEKQFVTYHWDKASELHSQPQKYQIVYFDTSGMAHFKSVRADKSGDMQSVWDYWDGLGNDGGELEFVVDPDQLDAVILEEEYHPLTKVRELIKEKTDRLQHNDKIRMKICDVEQAVQFAEDIKVGDSYYVNAKTQYTCTAKETMTIKKFKEKKYTTSGGYWRRREFDRGVRSIYGRKVRVTIDTVEVITWSSTSGKTLIHSFADLKKGRFYTAKPEYKTSKKLKL